MLTVLLTFPKWAKQAMCAIDSVILAFGCNHIKSVPQKEKAGHKTRKRLELYEANVKGVTFTFLLNKLSTGGQCRGTWMWALPLLSCSRTDLDAHVESFEG